MKKLLTIGILIIGLSLFSNTNLYAQGESGDVSIGGGLGFATEIESLGFQIGGTYQINEEFRGAADIIIYLPGDQGGGVVDVNWFEFNANAHYLFQNEEDLMLYALGGLNFTRVSIDFPQNEFFGGGNVSDTETGLNLGAGLEYNVGFGNLYAEAKYVISSADHLAVTGGVRIPINN